MEKEKQSNELLNRIRSELTAILAEEVSGDPQRKISYEKLIKPNPLPLIQVGSEEKRKPGKKDLKKTATFIKAPAYRQAISGKSINMKPSLEPHGKQSSASSPTPTSSATSVKSSWELPADRTLRSEFMESQAAKCIDEDLQKMQLELKQSYELFQGIGEKFDTINFGGLKNRIRDLHLSTSSDDIGKLTTKELHQMFETRYLQNRLDKLTTDAGQGFRRHPGEFGDIPELSTFFQACTQLEHGLDALRQQRRRSSELEKRLCWATEIAYDRMDEIRNAVGSKPESDF